MKLVEGKNQEKILGSQPPGHQKTAIISKRSWLKLGISLYQHYDQTII